jgi:hypothetical protein
MANPFEGTKPPAPSKGTNGPNDKNGGTRHFVPKLPKTNAPREGGTKK